ncbi:MAG: Hsp20 family protein [Candidatus Lokiarchaeota archaeon]|nr:Hsp20 family protein [Candidatus Lokiarchaeota archaeon]MBD3198444.1 Hsp20 family protein [Candidatus Lokiarchaeota archaeon]
MSKDIEVKKEKGSEGNEDDKKSRELSMRRDSPFSLFQEMDKMLDDINRNFLGDLWLPTRWPRFRIAEREEGSMFRTPLTNIKESDENFEITAEMPGLDKGDIEIMFHDDVLEIKGEYKEEEKEEKEGEVVRSEYRSSSYYRAFSMPENIDEDSIDATLDKGILTVKVPKKEPEPVEKKKIEVK